MKFSEYAADEGIAQPDDGIGMVLTTFATNAGAPNAPVNPLPFRVSTMRHGVIATNESGADSPAA